MDAENSVPSPYPFTCYTNDLDIGMIFCARADESQPTLGD